MLFAALLLLPAYSAPFFCAARLVPFAKKTGGLRTLAVGEVLRRLIAKILLGVHSTILVSALSPPQMGVGVKGASEAIARRLQRMLQAKSKLCVLQIDVSSAFNTVDRNAVLQRVQALIPALSSWAGFCYSQPSHLFAAKTTLFSEQGTQQGDPLGPALFSLAIQ